VVYFASVAMTPDYKVSNGRISENELQIVTTKREALSLKLARRNEVKKKKHNNLRIADI